MRKDVHYAYRAARGWVLPAVLAITACAHGSIAPVVPNDLVRYEPPPPGLEDVWLTGSSTGRLAYRNGCFRLERASPPGDATLIWPHSYRSVTGSDGRRGVSDGNGNAVFDGDEVTLGGGSGGDEAPTRMFQREIAIACGGPYRSSWIPF